MSNAAEFDEPTGLEIAIVGMTGRFSGAKNLDSFWQNLRDGVESITKFSDQELLAAGIDAATLSNPNYVKAGGTLEDIDLFDAEFFGYSPREAELIDPQQRLFLECAWEALEQAGYDPERYQGQIGVFAGVRLNSYWLNLYLSQGLQAAGEFQTMIGNESDHVTMRVAYKLNLSGPALTVQTSCSTSLVAVHLACQSLLSGSCDIALAGGASIPVPQKTGYWYQEGGPQSPDGRCRAFDAEARGMVSGSGVGVVVLKRLSDALDDRDTIHAVIKGSAVNNDGSHRVGYTAPGVEGQAKVIRAAHLMAEVDPGTIGYVEAHGTGTPVGDPIEITALTRAFRAGGTSLNPCAIGSIKTNIGHLDAAAGVAGLIKTVLALKHRQIPPSLHFQTPNPRIDFASTPFYVNTNLAEWQSNGTPRRAGVSSFGIGGTNAHVVLEEAPPAAESGPARPWQVLLLSAKTGAALEQATDNLAAYLRAQPSTNLADAAYTLQVGRKTFNYRRILVCRDHAEAIALLESRDPRQVLTTIQEPQERPVAFLFPGQGAQHVGMARDLYESEPVFRQWVDRCCALLQPHLHSEGTQDLRTLIYPAPGAEAEATERLTQTQFSQPALFVIEYALAQLWMSWGVQPSAMIGHSIGEYVAACLAGVFSLEDALMLVAARGRLMQALPAGAMLSVRLSESDLTPLLHPALALAAVNGPGSCVVAGEHTAIEALREQLAERGIDSRVLHTSHAFHSAMMEPIVAPFTAQVARAQLNQPRIPYLSNVTGTWITAAQATDPQYWARHLRQTVRFAAGLQELLREPSQVLLEVGPGQTLATFARQQLGPDTDRIVLSSLRHPQEQQPDLARVLKTLGQLWLADVPVDWQRFSATEQRQRVPLPTYPFERKSYWIEAQPQETNRGHARSVQRQPDLADWFYLPSWKRSVLPALPAPEDLAAQPRLWLLFVDSTGLGLQLAQRLEQAGQQVVTVAAGERFAASGERAYTIDPRQRDDYAALLAELDPIDQPLSTIIHMWNVTHDDPARSIEERLDTAQALGFGSLTLLAQALKAHNPPERIQLVVLSNNLLDVNGETAVAFEKATSLGPCKVIPQEYPQISCRSIDVALPSAQDWQARRLVDYLVAEIVAPTPDPVVAYRGSHRWAQTFEPIRMDQATAGRPRLRTNGVYLLYGGLLERGKALADYLARTAQARLVLIEPPGERADPAAVEALQQSGAAVLTIRADLDDLAAMQAAAAQAEQQFGSIHGLIDVVGVGEATFCPIDELDQAAYERGIHQAARRLNIIDAITRDRQLDFCLVQSSLAPILGGLGTASYCAANLLLDAFVYRHAQTDPAPWIGVNWENIRLDDAPEQGIGTSLAQLAITPAETAQVFERIVALGTAPQVIISSGNLAARLEQWIRRDTFQRTEQTDSNSAPTLYPRPNLRSAYVAPTNEIERRLAVIWQQLFGIEQVGIHDNFFELGGDSLLATQLVSQVQDAFAIELPLRSLFETSTMAELALVIAERVLEQIDPDLLAEITGLE